MFPLALGSIAGSGMFPDEVRCAGDIGVWAAASVEGRVAARDMWLGAGALSCGEGS